MYILRLSLLFRDKIRKRSHESTLYFFLKTCPQKRSAPTNSAKIVLRISLCLMLYLDNYFNPNHPFFLLIMGQQCATKELCLKRFVIYISYGNHVSVFVGPAFSGTRGIKKGMIPFRGSCPLHIVERLGEISPARSGRARAVELIITFRSRLC